MLTQVRIIALFVGSNNPAGFRFPHLRFTALRGVLHYVFPCSILPNLLTVFFAYTCRAAEGP